MADEANTPATPTTENSTPVDTAPAVTDTTPAPGDSVQATETTTPAADTEPAPEKPAKTYDEAYVKKLREEAAANRVKGDEKAKQAAQEAAAEAQRTLTEQIARTLGLIKDDTPPDPADLLKQAQDRETQLAAERDSVAKELRALRIEKALNDAAEKCDGDTSILAPYLAGTGALNKLDLAADDFASQMEAIVAAAVESNPKLKKTTAQVAAPRSGGDLSGGNAAPKVRGPKSVEEIRLEMRAKRENGGL
ncbi:hypothetical protein [Nocardia ignorata]|uniref:Scaffolding protein n=1 Tax=Nocardia ignorata TaxID=145285 RepID=A0A4R6NZK1_NOCIG|nr:hypothetical protein DFR75_11229 [Nocardia ignorata]